MTAKREHSNTAPKMYWAISNRLLYNKKIPAIPPSLLMVVLSQTPTEKQRVLIFFLILYAQL